MAATVVTITKTMAACPATNRRPWASSARTERAGAAPRSSRWMVSVEIIAAEKTNVAASTKKQAFSPSAATSTPAMAGPTTLVRCMVCEPRALATSSSSRPTRSGIATVCAGLKKAEAALRPKTRR